MRLNKAKPKDISDARKYKKRKLQDYYKVAIPFI